MNLIFVDTSALIALGNKKDQFHLQAMKAFKQLVLAKTNFITTNAIIFELTNAFSAVQYKPVAIKQCDMINNSKNWTLITIDEELTKKGMSQFKQMDDKDWSLVDCISMIIAEEIGITKIFSNDHHFEQAGFTILLK
jgi:predicted nucleic acid-binding protein